MLPVTLKIGFPSYSPTPAIRKKHWNPYDETKCLKTQANSLDREIFGTSQSGASSPPPTLASREKKTESLKEHEQRLDEEVRAIFLGVHFRTLQKSVR